VVEVGTPSADDDARGVGGVLENRPPPGPVRQHDVELGLVPAAASGLLLGVLDDACPDVVQRLHRNDGKHRGHRHRLGLDVDQSQPGAAADCLGSPEPDGSTAVSSAVDCDDDVRR
jgi:hypothetical protein